MNNFLFLLASLMELKINMTFVFKAQMYTDALMMRERFDKWTKRKLIILYLP